MHIIRPKTLEVSQVNTKSLRNAQTPTKKTELQSFLGLCDVYRRFTPLFTEIAAPLNKILQKNTPESFELDNAQLQVFQKFIDRVCSLPVLSLPQQDLP